MTPTSEPVQRHSPVCGIVAVILPLIGGVLGYAIIAGKPPGDAGWPNVIFGPLVLPAAAVCGLIVGVAGRVRRESYRPLSWVGLLLNCAALLYSISSFR